MKKNFISVFLLMGLQNFSQDTEFYDTNFKKTFESLEKSEYYKSIKLIDSVLNIANKKNNTKEQARFLVLKSGVYENIFDIEKAEQYNLKAMALFKSDKNEYMYNWTYMILIANYMYNKNYDEFYKNLPIIKANLKDNFLLFYISEMELRALYNQKKYTELLSIVDDEITKLKKFTLKKAETPFLKKRYQMEVSRYKYIYNMLKAFSLIEKDEFEVSDKLLNELIKIKFNDIFLLEEKDLKYESLIYQYKIKVLFNKKRYDSIPYYHQKDVKATHEFLDFIRKQSKNTKKTMRAILANKRRIFAINTQLKIEKQKNQNKSIVVSSFIILSLLLLFSRFRYRQSKVLIAKSYEIKLLNTWLQEKNEYLKDKNHKNTELITLNEHCVFSKTIQISTLRDNLQKIIKNLKILTKHKTVRSVDLFRIENELRSIISENDIWEEFKIQFEEIRPNFFNRLKEINPKLTVNDLKHCAYIIINLKISDVADLINVSPRTVETARYRLSKKLNIPTEIKLYDYIKNIGIS